MKSAFSICWCWFLHQLNLNPHIPSIIYTKYPISSKGTAWVVREVSFNSVVHQHLHNNIIIEDVISELVGPQEGPSETLVTPSNLLLQ